MYDDYRHNWMTSSATVMGFWDTGHLRVCKKLPVHRVFYENFNEMRDL